jgi:hypothetical protein
MTKPNNEICELNSDQLDQVSGGHIVIHHPMPGQPGYGNAGKAEQWAYDREMASIFARDLPPRFFN